MKDVPNLIRFDLAAQEFAQAMEELLRRQLVQNPVYRRYARTLGFDSAQVRDWRDFPPLPVEAFRQSEPAACFDTAQSHAVFETSGTTGPEKGLHYFQETATYEYSLEAAFSHFMPDLRSHLWISLIPPASALPRSSLSHMLSHLAARLPEKPVSWVMDGSFQRGDTAWEEALRKAGRNPAALFSTVFALVQALDHAASEGRPWSLAPGSVLFLTGGSKGRAREIAPEALQTLIATRLGLSAEQVHFEYGMTELSSQGYARGFDAVYCFPPWMRVVARDPVTGKCCPPGETGLLEFYDLANTGSAAALRTRDAGQVFTHPDEPSRALLLGRAAAAPARGCSLPYEAPA